jgi:hypothetical protein
MTGGAQYSGPERRRFDRSPPQGGHVRAEHFAAELEDAA